MATSTNAGRWPRNLGILSLLLFVTGPVLARFGIVPAMAGFLMFVGGGFLGLLAFVGGFVRSFRSGLGVGRAGIFLGAIPGALFVWLAIGASEFPPINDISTDLDDPPPFFQAQVLPQNAGRDMDYPDGFREIVRSSYPDLGPLVLPDPPQQVFDRALLIARGVPGWRITAVHGSRLMFEGVATTSLFRFQDDFVIRARPSDGGSRVDMRSKSRDGRGDIGANATRIREFFGKLRAAR